MPASPLTSTPRCATTTPCPNFLTTRWCRARGTCAQGGVLLPGQNCKIAVIFTPTSAGRLTGTLAVSDDAENSPQFPLTGVGVQGKLVWNPQTINFGKVAVTTTGTTTSPTKTLALLNPNPVPMTLSVGAPSGNGFSQQSSTCGSSLPEKQSCELTYTFTPPAAGELSATVTITDDAVRSPQSVNLVGVGK